MLLRILKLLPEG